MRQQLLVFAFSLLFSHLSSATASVKDSPYKPIFHQCMTRGQGGDQWNACIYAYPNHSNKVLYYFNGIGGSELTWRDSEFEKQIIKRWIDTRDAPPVVIAINFKVFFLNKLIWFAVEKNSSPLSGKFEKLTQEVLPLVQQKWLSRFKVKENLLLGVSMGAFNAAQLYFKMPGYFSKTALICMPSSIVSPFDDRQAVDDYIRRTQAHPLVAWFALGAAKDFMPTPLEWYRHSPLSLAERFLSPTSPPLFVANGTADVFGFDEGNMAFAEIARAKGARITSHFYDRNNHCFIDPQPLAEFFARN